MWFEEVLLHKNNNSNQDASLGCGQKFLSFVLLSWHIHGCQIPFGGFKNFLPSRVRSGNFALCVCGALTLCCGWHGSVYGQRRQVTWLPGSGEQVGQVVGQIPGNQQENADTAQRPRTPHHVIVSCHVRWRGPGGALRLGGFWVMGGGGLWSQVEDVWLCSLFQINI